MRAREFITEQTGSITHEVGLALPGAFRIPALKNQDPYLQYRFGVALAAANGRDHRKADNLPEFQPESVFGENAFVVSYDEKVVDTIRDAVMLMGLSAEEAERVGDQASNEAPDVGKTSPVKAFKGYGL